jgi:hypothetical protein
MISNSSTFSGYLVGIGKITKDGAMDHRFLDTPIKNMIVKQGLNNWLRYNGSDTALINADYLNSADSVSRAFGYPLENIQWCAYGSSNSPSNFANTVELGNRLVDQYTTKQVKWPYCGASRYNTSQVRNRVTHISSAAETDASVNEIGYYLKLSDGTFQMFSRVVLPSPYELSAGEQLITTYELVYDVANVVEPTEPFLTGLYDANGLQLEAKKKIIFSVPNTLPCSPACPSIYEYNGNAYNNVTPSDSYSLYLPIYSAASNRFRIAKHGYSTSAYDFRDTFANVTTLTAGPTSSYETTSPTVVSRPYAYDSFYRDSVWTLPQYWPTLSAPTDTISIYFLKLGAVDLQFGHTVDGTWTPTPWLKRGNTITTITVRHTISTPESIAWQQSQS